MEKPQTDASMEEILARADEGRFPPEFLAAYEAMECLGASPLGETLLVRSRADGSLAVAKCSDARRAGAKSEGELLKKLHHPALPAFLAEYRGAQTVCIVREYIEGVTLSEAARESPFTEAEVLAVGLQLCDVLGYLHGQTPPIIHRDIKPENIICRKDGSIALIDFGISREYDADASKDTQSFGTVSFAPPEQYGYAQTDCRSDLFSLGMVLGCLITGSTRVDSFADIQDKRLAHVIRTCTAFDPAGRYHDVRACRRALLELLPAQRKKRGWLIGALCVLAVAAAAVVYTRHAPDGRAEAAAIATASPEPAIVFTEPLIEKAVRLQLGKSDTDALTAEELESVETLCAFGPTPYTDENGFYAGAEDWYAADARENGGISSLEDLKMLPNLRCVCLAAQRITDLTPLRGLSWLEKVEFKHNRIQDVSVLAELPALASVGVNDNPVRDLSPLAACEGLRFLDLCSVSDYDPAFFTALGDFEFLDIANDTDSYAYLGERRIRELKLGHTSLDTLDYLSGVAGLEYLELKYSGLTSLAGIEQHPEIRYLNIAGCPIGDLSPLEALPALTTLVVSEDMRPSLDALGAQEYSVILE